MMTLNPRRVRSFCVFELWSSRMFLGSHQKYLCNLYITKTLPQNNRYGTDIRFSTDCTDSLHDLSDCMGTDVFGDVETQGVPSLEAVGYERFQRDGEQQN